ncbi:DUF3078 domain-containing protein [Sabulilitoribacter multivorans]|uniref:DUF3078 domain-containing protein n=1 Tax=Flaviramulus multivorans TaxID=1304750 RepID=A0ABS9ILK5_9FLAO|nr:DUF3078 domain-containing protein [Flaviramulus multivorans]MCF7561481.1 DUF3078 domain-containing protein [Flaviramulus multivorans]
MKKVLFPLLCLCIQCVIAQPDSLFLKKEKKPYQGPQWVQKNKASIDLNEVAFFNWNSGGTNSISALIGLRSSLNYKDKFFNWKNNMLVDYGINKQQKRETRKTDDLFEVNSNLGFRPDSLSNWFYSARLNFRTQLTNGYNYPNTDEPISRLLSPGYLFFGGGMEYGKNIETLSFYFSPITLKATFVLDENLANAGAFGVTPAVLDDSGNVIIPGEKIRREVGVLVTNSYETKIVENVNVKHQVSLYSDYINNFGNVDLDWRVDFDFKVNSFVRATLGSHLRYDDDVKTLKPSEIEGEFDEAGAKIQWKQFLGVGFAVDF